MEDLNLGDLNLEGLGDAIGSMGEYFGGDMEDQDDGHYCDDHVEEPEDLEEEYLEEELPPSENEEAVQQNQANPQRQRQRDFNPDNSQPRQDQGRAPGGRQQQNNNQAGIQQPHRPPPAANKQVNRQANRQPAAQVAAGSQQAFRQPAVAWGVAVNPQAYRGTAAPVQYPPPGSAVWSSELFSCFDDIPLCCLTCWCPCIVFGRMAEIVDKGATTFTTAAIIYAAMTGTLLQFVYSCSYRNKIRLQYGIAGDDFEDYCIHVWCESCALTQEYKELTARGYDLPLGWHVNAAMQKQAQAGEGIQMPPRAPNGMRR